MSRLVLLRHGQASFGAAHYDALSAAGREQALATGAFWAARGEHYTQVWTGPRARHTETASLALAALGSVPAAQPPEAALDEFAEGQQILAAAERRLGHTLQGSSPQQMRQHYSQEIDAWCAGRVQIPGVPAAAQFRATVAAWLDRVTLQDGASHSLLAATSGGVIAALVCQVLDLPDARMADFMRVVANASITELVWSSGRRAALSSFNQTLHLPPSLITRV